MSEAHSSVTGVKEIMGEEIKDLKNKRNKRNKGKVIKDYFPRIRSEKSPFFCQFRIVLSLVKIIFKFQNLCLSLISCSGVFYLS